MRAPNLLTVLSLALVAAAPAAVLPAIVLGDGFFVGPGGSFAAVVETP